MDQDIQERLHVYEREGLASSGIVAFVREMLLWLEKTSGHACTEEMAGVFASHLMLALARVSRGEQLGDVWDQEVHVEAMAFKELRPWAEYIREQARARLHLELPEAEIDFLLLHLGTFLARYDDPLVSQAIR